MPMFTWILQGVWGTGTLILDIPTPPRNRCKVLIIQAGIYIYMYIYISIPHSIDFSGFGTVFKISVNRRQQTMRKCTRRKATFLTRTI